MSNVPTLFLFVRPSPLRFQEDTTGWGEHGDMPPPVAHDVTLNFGRPDIAKFILDALNATPSATLAAGVGLSGTGATTGIGAAGTTPRASGNVANAATKRMDNQVCLCDARKCKTCKDIVYALARLSCRERASLTLPPPVAGGDATLG